MYSEDELSQLKNEEDELTEAELAALLATLHITLSSLENEIRLFYQKYGKDGIITYSEAKKWISASDHTRRLTLLHRSIAELFDTGFGEFSQSFSDHLENIASLEAQFFGVEIDISNILETQWGIDNSTWLKRLTAHNHRWATQIANDLKLSFLKQEDVLDVLENVAKRGKSMETILKRLWRTEANAVSSIARHEVYKTLGVTKYRFLHLDGCVCEVCSGMHKQVFPISEYVVGVTANPLHPNCGDITEPILN